MLNEYLKFKTHYLSLNSLLQKKILKIEWSFFNLEKDESPLFLYCLVKRQSKIANLKISIVSIVNSYE